MNTITRRQFMKQTTIMAGAASVLGASATNLTATPLGLPIGAQVWPHRSMLHDFPAFVKKISGIGVTSLELCSPIGYGAEFSSLANGKEVARILSDHGMSCVSSHFSMAELRKSQDRSLEWAQQVGIKQIITATLADGNGGSNPTLDQVKHAAEEYNRIAEISAKAGLQQGLHNEGFELSMTDGQRTYDRLFDLLDPKLVKFQFQMSTITAGLIAADYFHKYPGRFFSIHLQDVDMKSGDGNNSNKASARHPQVPLGQGSIDWKKTFEAAKVGGVKNYFVEQTWELTEKSVAFLKAVSA